MQMCRTFREINKEINKSSSPGEPDLARFRWHKYTDNLSSLLGRLCVSAVITLTAVDICRALAVSTGTFKKQQGVSYCLHPVRQFIIYNNVTNTCVRKRHMF